MNKMKWLPGGKFRMGSNNYYPEEAPVKTGKVDGFWIDVTPVTNAQFRKFIKSTGYITTAEIRPDPADFPGADLSLLVPGSLVFRSPNQGSVPRHYSDWWFYIPDACWHRPDGVHPLTEEDDNKPVVQVSWHDAMAHAKWAGKSLPTESEWEYAARGGRKGSEFAWGEEFMPEGKIMANTWHGTFPFPGETGEHRYFSTSPVGVFPANGFGLYDMIGNVWEWTVDSWQPDHSTQQRSCCGAKARHTIEQKVMKGGSHLCAPNYCQRYRPAARHAQSTDSSTTHIGFRCIKRP